MYILITILKSYNWHRSKFNVNLFTNINSVFVNHLMLDFLLNKISQMILSIAFHFSFQLIYYNICQNCADMQLVYQRPSVLSRFVLHWTSLFPEIVWGIFSCSPTSLLSEKTVISHLHNVETSQLRKKLISRFIWFITFSNKQTESLFIW